MVTKAQIPLRIGLGLTYLYSGFGLLKNPIDWSGFAPLWLIDLTERFTSVELFFRVQGVGELLLALALFAWFLPTRVLFYVAILGAIHVLLIILSVGVDFVTFRDVGLLGAWLSLVLLMRESK